MNRFSPQEIPSLSFGPCEHEICKGRSVTRSLGWGYDVTASCDIISHNVTPPCRSLHRKIKWHEVTSSSSVTRAEPDGSLVLPLELHWVPLRLCPIYASVQVIVFKLHDHPLHMSTRCHMDIA